MEFYFSKEQQDIKRAAAEFASKEFPSLAHQCEEGEIYPMELVKKAADLGFIGINIPLEYGGGGYGYVEKCILCEEFWRIDPGLGSVLISATFGSDMLVLYGTEEQKKRYLMPVTKGETVMGSAITEPDSGSDVASISTRAIRDTDHYVINGSKIFITNATVGGFFMVLCLTDPENPHRHRRHSVILVERDREGFEATKIRGKMGIRASDTGEITFSNVKVPLENLIGKENMGFYQFMEFFNRTRIHVGAEGVGIAQGALDHSISHVRKREQFGKRLKEFQAIQFKIAEMATLIEAARTLVYRAAHIADSSSPDPKLTAMAKWFSGYVAVRVSDEAVQIHGGYGYISEYGVDRFFRASKIIEIYEGTKEIEKLIISRSIL